jgi:predicted nucleic acid-binding protein
LRFLLDTNVVSEALRKKPDPKIADWLGGASDESLFLSALTIGEIRRGIEKKVHDRRKREELERFLAGVVSSYGPRILPIDAAVAECWGGLSRRRSLCVVDGLIAATAIVHNLVLASGDNSFSAAAINKFRVFNPWREAPPGRA